MLIRTLIGNAIEITYTFADNDGVAVNPSAVRVRLKPPGDAAEIVLTPTPDAGSVTVTHKPTTPGRWVVRVETDDPDSAEDDTFQVTHSSLPSPN